MNYSMHFLDLEIFFFFKQSQPTKISFDSHSVKNVIFFAKIYYLI